MRSPHGPTHAHRYTPRSTTEGSFREFIHPPRNSDECRHGGPPSAFALARGHAATRSSRGPIPTSPRTSRSAIAELSPAFAPRPADRGRVAEQVDRHEMVHLSNDRMGAGSKPERFDAQARSFDARAGLPADAARAVARAVLDLAALGPDDLLVELGAGTGQIGRELAESVRYVGVDRSSG